jgi:diguanylate cyclase (GGDEF)-like protein
MEEKLQYLAYYDSLTGLPNGNLFLERINQEIAEAKNSSSVIAVLITDINKFKSIYDIYGSEVGGRVLKEVAERLSTAIRKGDIAAHLGNDEFAIASMGITGSDDIIMLEKIINDIS